MRKQGFLLSPAKRPAGRIIGGIDDQQFGLGRDGRQQFGHVERPLAGHRPKADTAKPGAHDQRLGRQVRPDWRDSHHLIARIHQRLHRQHQGIHAPRSHRNPVYPNRYGASAAQPCRVLGNGFAQLRQA